MKSKLGFDAKPVLMDYSKALHTVLQSIPGAYEEINRLRVAEKQQWENEVASSIASSLNVTNAIAKVAVKHSRLSSTALERAQKLNELMREVEELENNSKFDSVDDLELFVDE